LASHMFGSKYKDSWPSSLYCCVFC